MSKTMPENSSNVPIALADPFEETKLKATTATIKPEFRESSNGDFRNTFAIKLIPKQKVTALLVTRRRSFALATSHPSQMTKHLKERKKCRGKGRFPLHSKN